MVSLGDFSVLISHSRLDPDLPSTRTHGTNFHNNDARKCDCDPGSRDHIYCFSILQAQAVHHRPWADRRRGAGGYINCRGNGSVHESPSFSTDADAGVAGPGQKFCCRDSGSAFLPGPRGVSHGDNSEGEIQPCEFPGYNAHKVIT